MKVKDFNTLVKLMQMTFSESDGEALTALRKGNGILLANNLNWQQVLNKVVQLEVEEAPPEPEPSEKESAKRREIEAAFEIMTHTQLSGSFAQFIDSLREQYFDTGRLSMAQRDALFKAARKQRDNQR